MIGPALIASALSRHLETGRIDMPAGGELVWKWFADLSAARTWRERLPDPIGYPDIIAYAQLARVPIAPGHVVALRAMDRVFVAYFEKLASAPSGAAAPGAAATNMTPGLFDAMFSGRR